MVSTMGRGASLIAVLLLIGAAVSRTDALAQAPALFAADQFDAVDLVPSQSSGGGAGLLETLGSLTDRFEPINGFSEGNKYRRLGRAIGRLKIFFAVPTGEEYLATCTASLIAPDRIITNYHCVPGLHGITVVQVKVEFLYLDLGSSSMRAFAAETTPVEADAALDYSILKVLGEPARTAGITPLRFSPRNVRNNESLFLIHHPAGQPQRLTRAYCRAHATKALDGKEMRHLCDTLPGSSGALVFADDDLALVGLHHKGGLAPGDMSSFNRGTDASALKSTSPILAAAVPAPVLIAPPIAVPPSTITPPWATRPSTLRPLTTLPSATQPLPTRPLPTQPSPAQRQAMVPPKPTPPAPDWLRYLPVKLSEANAGLLTDLEATRKAAVDAALTGAEAKDRLDLEQVIAGEPQPVSEQELLGKWRCRSLQFGGLGLYIYDYFGCQITKEQGALVLEKTTGSQRYRGTLYRITNNRFAFVGVWITDFDQGDMVAVLVKAASKRLRLEIPQDRGGFEFSDLVR